MKEILIIILTVSVCMFLGIQVGKEEERLGQPESNFQFFREGYLYGHYEAKGVPEKDFRGAQINLGDGDCIYLTYPTSKAVPCPKPFQTVPFALDTTTTLKYKPFWP